MLYPMTLPPKNPLMNKPTIEEILTPKPQVRLRIYAYPRSLLLNLKLLSTMDLNGASEDDT